MITRITLGTYHAAPSLYNTVNIHYGPQGGRDTGYELKSIQGIQPPPVEVGYSQYASTPGGRFHSASPGVRSMTLRVGLDPSSVTGKSVAQLRRDFYHSVPAGETIAMLFHIDGSYELRIDGYVEAVETDYFSQDTDLIVSIVCPEPYFRGPGSTRLEDLEPGYITLHNGGDIPSGFRVNFIITGTFNNTIYLRNNTTGAQLNIASDEWGSGTTLHVNTQLGERSVTLRHSSSGNLIQHLLGRTSIDVGWPELIRGDNQLRVWSANSHNWTWNITYPQYYGGI